MTICHLALRIILLLTVAVYKMPDSFAQDRDQCLGGIVNSITFSNRGNLNARELKAQLPLSEGTPYSNTQLEESRQVLMERGIFKHVDPVVTCLNNKVQIVFVLAPLEIITGVEFRGYSFFGPSDLSPVSRRLLRAKFTQKDADEVSRQLLDKYRDAGFYETAISHKLLGRGKNGQLKIRFNIAEGRRCEIASVTVSGDFPSELVAKKQWLIDQLVGAAPSREFLKEIEQAFLIAVRKEGYLQARIESSEPSLVGSAKVTLQYLVRLGPPVTLHISGNNAMSVSDLLKPLDIEGKTTPLGPWAVTNLCKDLKSLYEEAGFFFVSVDCENEGVLDGRQGYKITIDEGLSYQLKTIRFHGNKYVKSSIIRSLMRTKAAEEWSFWPFWRPRLVSKTLAEDLVNLQEYYIYQGYPQAAVTFQLHTEPTHGYLSLDILVDEGEPKTVESVSFRWEDTPPVILTEEQKHALESLADRVIPGSLWQVEAFDAARKAIESSLKSQGFPGAVVRVVAEESQTKIIFLIQANRLVRVGRILCRGNLSTHDNVIYRKLFIHKGDRWSEDLIERSVQRLYEAALFRSVSIEPLDGVYDSEVEDLVVNVTERDPATLKLGLFFNTEDGVQLQAEKRQRNWRGRGENISVGVDGVIKSRFLDSGRAWITYKIPEIFNNQEELQLDGYELFGSRLYKGFSYDRTGASAGLRKPISSAVKVYLGIDQYRERVFDTTADISFGADDSGRRYYGKLRGELEYDGRDNALLPTTGTRCAINAAWASRYFGSDVDYGELLSECAHWLPLGGPFSLAVRARGGYLHPFESTDVAPLSSRYFLGGRDTLRGFSPGAIGPRSSEGRIAGGDAQIVGNTELSYLLTENISLLSFFDVGQAFLFENKGFEGDDPSLSDLRMSPGLGLRYLTPVGPLGVEYGVAINPQNGERPGRFFAGIGGAF